MKPALDGRELRRLMGAWTTGVAVVTSRAADGPRGCTTNAFTSLSLEPPLVLVCFDLRSNTLAAVRASGRFAVNVLAADQLQVAQRFATKCSGDHKFEGIEHDDAGGVPVLAGAVAWVACELDSEFAGGDHAIATGRPIESGGDPDASPLIFFRGGYGSGWWETTRSP